ncbi:MAG: D-2-hydroxyacid dehydrogenase [Xanthomonadales bacterium]|nr:D-2-hydroxyacid dehydrogenase [Xanthomonadales bacterium]
MNRLLILAADAEKYTNLIKAAELPQLEVMTASDAGSSITMAAGCNIVLGDPPMISEVLASAGRLEWVQSTWAGVDQLCQPDMRRDYLLTGAKEIFGPTISEYVITYLFALERRLFNMRDNQLERKWRPLTYRPARIIKLGIIGLGSIGRKLASTARHFGIQVVGLNRSGRSCDEVEKVYGADNLAGFLGSLDYVVLTLPATAQTRNFINADVLKLMKPTAVLINVGRGNSINEADLVCALSDGVIGGAVLDVFENEPLDRESPLWQLSNVYITPHTAAVSFPEDITGIFIENYQRFLRKEPLQHVVDFELGY